MMVNQRRRTGDIVCMKEGRFSKCLFYGELLHGKRAQRKPRNCCKDNIKNNLKLLKIDILL